MEMLICSLQFCVLQQLYAVHISIPPFIIITNYYPICLLLKLWHISIPVSDECCLSLYHNHYHLYSISCHLHYGLFICSYFYGFFSVYFSTFFFIFCIILHLSTSFCDSAAVTSKFPPGLESMKSYFVISYKSEMLDSYHLPHIILLQDLATKSSFPTDASYGFKFLKLEMWGTNPKKIPPLCFNIMC